jgi:hypothetical protein
MAKAKIPSRKIPPCPITPERFEKVRRGQPLSPKEHASYREWLAKRHKVKSAAGKIGTKNRWRPPDAHCYVWIAEKLSFSGEWEPQAMDTNRKMLAASISVWFTAQGGRWRIRKYERKPSSPEANG